MSKKSAASATATQAAAKPAPVQKPAPVAAPAPEALPEFKPNLDKLRKLQQQHASVVIGGKGVPRRKKKVVHKTATTDDKKLQSTLKKLALNQIQGIDEVNMFKDSGEVLHFSNPKVQAALSSNIFAISGQSETKQLADMLSPSIMQQLGGGGAGNMFDFKALAQQLQNSSASKQTSDMQVQNAEDDDDDVPQLVENFDEASKNEKI